MIKTYLIRLEENDLGQLLDGMDARAEAWEKTAKFHYTGVPPEDFIVEDCTDADEAERIATHFRSIISRIEEQREAQS